MGLGKGRAESGRLGRCGERSCRVRGCLMKICWVNGAGVIVCRARACVLAWRETRGRVDRVRFNFLCSQTGEVDRVELVLRRGEVLDDGDLVAAQVELAVLERAQEGRRARYQICGERHKARPRAEALYRGDRGPRGADSFREMVSRRL